MGGASLHLLDDYNHFYVIIWWRIIGTVSRHFRPKTGHFGPKTFRHNETGAEVSGQICTRAELSCRHFGTVAELSRSPANIFATVGRTEERFNITVIN